jgi:hypothetical protein
MKHVTTGEPMRADAGCRHLAVRVIEQAVRDLSASGVPGGFSLDRRCSTDGASWPTSVPHG